MSSANRGTAPSSAFRSFRFVNGVPFGRPNAGIDMTFDFGQLIAHAATHSATGGGHGHRLGHRVQRGSDGGPGKPMRKAASATPAFPNSALWRPCSKVIPRTPFLKLGDVVRVEMVDDGGHSIFGAIEQEVRSTSS